MGEAFYGDDYRGSDLPWFAGIQTFLKLPYVRTFDELKKVRPNITIIGEPMDWATTAKSGTRHGPKAIRAASTSKTPPYEHFSIEVGIDPFAIFKVVDYGDVHVIPGDVIESHNRITSKILEILEVGSAPVALGGDHSITYANVRAMAKKFNGKIGLIHLDAHADCKAVGGYKYDHGSFVRRIYELGCLRGKNYTLIGARGYWPGPDLYNWMKSNDFDWFTMQDIEERGIADVAKEAIERANDGTEAVWISWDIDSFDPAYAPGTGTLEANGLTSREGIHLMRLLSKSFDYTRFGFDITEVSPPYDVGDSNSYSGGITSVLANRLIVELLQGLAMKRRGLSAGSPIRPNYRE